MNSALFFYFRITLGFVERMTAVVLLIVVSLGPLNIGATSGEGIVATCKFEIHLFYLTFSEIMMPCITYNWNYQAIMLFIENGI